MSHEMRTVMEFCLRYAGQAPVAERISLYLGLAKFCSDARMAAKYRRMAVKLQSAERACRRAHLDLTHGGPAL